MMTCLVSAFNVEDVDIEEVIAEVTAVVGERPSLVTTRPGQPWVGLTTDCAIHIAHDERTRGRPRGGGAPRPGAWGSCGGGPGGGFGGPRPGPSTTGCPAGGPTSRRPSEP